MCSGTGPRKANSSSPTPRHSRSSRPSRPQTSQPQYLHVSRKAANGKTKKSLHIQVHELERANGDVERICSRLPYGLEADAVEDTFVMKKRELRYDRLCRTRIGRGEARRIRAGSAEIAAPSERSSPCLEVASGSTRTQTTDSQAEVGQSERRKSDPSVVPDTDRLSASMITRDGTDCAQTASQGRTNSVVLPEELYASEAQEEPTISDDLMNFDHPKRVFQQY
ncbi:hypothetical protein ST47_g2015 [Ascochyta rabiei]|uniref:Uncharacterized protein n=1 Tax=Didymella rabiei TaxID=5454 RepID=A0A163K884_DIDRA|nr:hypothetical protein ST47_g2015 [Ascochyta rabiei]